MADTNTILFDNVAHTACPSCKTDVDVDGLEAFSKVVCPHCGAEFSVPAKLANFKLLSCLGVGGMGSVYRAYDETLARIVAIKVMQKSLGGNPEFLESFRREAQAAAKLNHPNIAQIYSFGQEKGQPYIVMELVPGKHFDDMISQPDPLDQAMVVKIGMDIADGLQLAAASNLIHGDIKPENILLDDRDVAKLVDFGIASSPNRGEGEIWGTPYYIAPEKLRRQRVDFRSDIYCLGGTLYHALTQHPPFEGADAMAVVKARLEHPPQPMKTFRPDIDDEVVAIVDRMLQLEPAMRYPTYGSLLSDMSHYLSRVHPQSPSSSSASSKKIIIKGRGKTAVGASTGVHTGAHTASVSTGTTGKHPLIVSRGATGNTQGMMTSRRSSQQLGDASHTYTSQILTGSEPVTQKRGLFFKLGVLAGVLLLIGGIAVGGYFLTKNSGGSGIATAPASGQNVIIERNNALCAIRDAVSAYVASKVATYDAQAGQIMEVALTNVSIHADAALIPRITYVEPPAADLSVESGSATNGQTLAASDATNAVDHAEISDVGAVAQDVADEMTESVEEVPLDAISQYAREIFLALQPVRDARVESDKSQDEIATMVAKASEYLNPSVAPMPVEEEKQALEIGGYIATAKELFARLQGADELCAKALRDADEISDKLIAEVARREAENKAQAAKQEAERKRLADEEQKRQEEEAQLAAEKSEHMSIGAKVLEYMPKAQEFRCDMVKNGLARFAKNSDFKFKSSRKILDNAIKRIERLENFQKFIIERLNDTSLPFKSRKYGGWSVTEASMNNIKTLVGGKYNVFTWKELGTERKDQLAEIAQFYLVDPRNAKEMLSGERARQLTNMAIFYLTAYNGGANYERACQAARDLLKEAFKLRPATKEEIFELIPELDLGVAQ